MFQVLKMEENLGKNGSEDEGSISGHKTRGKRNKKIAKQQKSQELGQLLEGLESFPKSKLTRHQRVEIQKEKNRLAAQMSRDRQKKYVQELQERVEQLENIVSSNLCKKCKCSLLFEEDKTDQFFQSSHQDDPLLPLPIQSESNELEIENSSLYRQEVSSLSFKSISHFLLIVAVMVSLAAFGASVESTTDPSRGRVMQQVGDDPFKQYEETGKNISNNRAYFSRLIGEKCQIVNTAEQDKAKEKLMKQLGINKLYSGQWQYNTESIICSTSSKQNHEIQGKMFTQSVISTILDTPHLIHDLQYKQTRKNIDNRKWVSGLSIVQNYVSQVLSLPRVRSI